MSEKSHADSSNSDTKQSSSTHSSTFDTGSSSSINNSISKVNNSHNIIANNTIFGDISKKSSPTPHLFGQFNGTPSSPGAFGSSGSFGNLSLKETPAISSGNNLFANALGKLSTNFTSVNGGFSSASAPLQSSLASLGANKPLFGGQQSIPTSFADITTKSLSQSSSHSTDQPTSANNNIDSTKNSVFDSNREHSSSVVLNGESKPSQSLVESAAEYESKRSSGLINIQGDTSTGEEDEITKFQMGGKLFVYNSEKQQFTERGYGILKINDRFDEQTNRYHSRLIMRLDKSFRVILNSPIIYKMTVERATDRSVRFGAQDENILKVFVIKATPYDCIAFQSELKTRIQIIERLQLEENQKNEREQQTRTTKNNDLNDSFGDSSQDDSLLPVGIRKRSHSRSGSDTSDNGGDISKKSKIVKDVKNSEDDDDQPSQPPNNDAEDENVDDDSENSYKKSEQETAAISPDE